MSPALLAVLALHLALADGSPFAAGFALEMSK
jgi:hypothetical protein